MRELILVGGFLGAGKTTLLYGAAKNLVERGKKVALITNDQAPDLVDTELLRKGGLEVGEIAGGCFCCRFDQLIDTSDKLIESQNPDVIIGEPVGSCTDLSATVLQPIKDLHADRFHLAPFSVLTDPIKLVEVLHPDRGTTMHPSAAYIYHKQLEEADYIIISKIDTLNPAQLASLKSEVAASFPLAKVMAISSETGVGMDEWLDEMLAGQTAGTHIIEIDYDIYAEGEAILGWLNCTAQLTSTVDVDWKALSQNIIDNLHNVFKEKKADIAHLKLIMSCLCGENVLANITNLNGDSKLRGELTSTARSAHLTINARVEMTPEELKDIVENTLKTSIPANIEVEMEDMVSLSPGRPTPTHRYKEVVGA